MSASLPALVVALNVLLMVWTMMLVGGARRRFGIVAPATTGHPEFERVFRAQMNTLEATAQFLPSLWLAASFWDATIAGWVGLAWIAGRAGYVVGYIGDARRRAAGFVIGFVATMVLLLGGGYGLVSRMLAS